MKIKLTLMLAAYLGSVFGQKLAISDTSYKTWTEATAGNLTKDGRYACYVIKNYPLDRTTLKVVTTAGKEIYSALDVKQVKFTEDSRFLFGRVSGDSLLRFSLRTGETKMFCNISKYELKIINDRERLFIEDKYNKLTVCDYDGKELYSAAGVKQHVISETGKSLIIELNTNIKDSVVLSWITTDNFSSSVVYKGKSVNSIIVDREDQQVAFLVENDNGSNAVFHSNIKYMATEIIPTSDQRILPNYKIRSDQYWIFSHDCQRLYFSMIGEELLDRRNTNSNELQVWSYKDTYSEQYVSAQHNSTFKSILATFDIKQGRLTKLTSGNEIIVPNTFYKPTDTIAVVESRVGNAEEFWNRQAISDYFLLNTVTGNRKPIESDCRNFIGLWNVSPMGKFIVYFNRDRETYMCYDICKNTSRTLFIPDTLLRYGYLDRPVGGRNTASIAITGWLAGEKSVLINAMYDIWKVSPTNEFSPENITLGTGRKKKIIYFSAYEQEANKYIPVNQILLTGISTVSKQFGLFDLSLLRTPTLKVMSIGDRWIGWQGNLYTSIDRTFLIGNYKSGYLLKMQSATSAPNYYYSKDLKLFNELSGIQPHNKYKWLSSDLHTYRDELGRELQGVLYKPEGFDSTKKYPVIINIYETKSFLLNAYESPSPVGAELNIPLMVANGYLVFLADVKGIIGEPGLGALLSVKAAREQLIKNSWVDSTKFGLIGHSFGAFETSYIMTHSRLFRAGIVAAGVSNMVVASTSVFGSGNSKQSFYMNSSYMLEETLSDNPKRYLDNSPILCAKSLEAPILFVHNDNDKNVLVDHTRNMFSVLRSLGKKCWWLNYKGQPHGVEVESMRLDYQHKILEFYNSFLKDQQLPQWMKQHN